MVMPGFKQTVAGVIPEDWDAVELNAVCSMKSGEAITAARINDFSDYPCYGGNGLRGYTSRFTHEGRFALIGRQGALCGNVVGAQGKFFASEHAVVVTARAGTDIAFLTYVLGEMHLNRYSESSAQPGLSVSKVLKLSLAVPPTEAEEVAIATTLSDVDALLGGLERLIAKKRDLRAGAMQRLLTGETRLPGFTDPWQEKRLGDHVSFLRNGIHSRAQLTVNDPVCYLHYGDIHVSSSIRLDVSKAMMPRLPAAAAARLTRLEDGDVVFVDASEDLVGVGKSVEIAGANGVEAVAGQHTIAARFDKQVLADGFKGYLQFFPTFIAHLRRLAAGTKVYATNRKHIASAEIALPELDEQRAIARVLSDMEAEIVALEVKLAKTRDLKQAMMQALLTGRVRLPVSRVETCEPEAVYA